MTLAERIRALAEALPTEEAKVELSRADLVAMLQEDGTEAGSRTADEEQLMDLSVTEIMAATQKARSTVIGWINSGQLESYRFGREHRITRAAWRSFLDCRRRGENPARASPVAGRLNGVADLSGWRRLAGANANRSSGS